MGIAGVFGCVSLACAFVAAACAAVLACGPRRTSAPVSGEQRAGKLAWYLRNGVRVARPIARWLAAYKRVRVPADEAVTELSTRGYATAREPLISVFVVVVALLAVGATAVSASPVCGAATAGCAVLAATSWAGRAATRRGETLREAVPDALRSMGVCFESGLSLLQTFRQTAAETDGPLRSLFEQAAHRLETGQSASNALEAFRTSASVPELAFVAVALDVQHEAGGSMKQVLDSVRDTVKGEIDLKRSLRVQTAQAKLSAQVVSILPFALVALFSLVSDDFLAPFFESVAGMALLGVALAMQAAGIVIVRRMLSVEVA